MAYKNAALFRYECMFELDGTLYVWEAVELTPLFLTNVYDNNTVIPLNIQHKDRPEVTVKRDVTMGDLIAEVIQDPKEIAKYMADNSEVEKTKLIYDFYRSADQTVKALQGLEMGMNNGEWSAESRQLATTVQSVLILYRNMYDRLQGTKKNQFNPWYSNKFTTRRLMRMRATTRYRALECRETLGIKAIWKKPIRPSRLYMRPHHYIAPQDMHISEENHISEVYEE